MLRIDIRALRQGTVEVDTEVPGGDPVFAGLGLTFEGPVRVLGTVQSSGQGTYRWVGQIVARVHGECRRCLAPVEMSLAAPVDAVFSADPEALDDPGVYPLEEPVTEVDLSGPVREEVGLQAPAFPLCRANCAGLCPRCGADLNQGPCACATAPEPV